MFQVAVNVKFQVARGQENLADNTGRLAEQYLPEEGTNTPRTTLFTLVGREDGEGDRNWPR